jgi:aspartyl protease family protein
LTSSSGASAQVRGYVDTGAHYSLVPRAVLERLGVVPFDSMTVQFADGGSAVWEMGEVRAELLGRSRPIIVFFGADPNQVLIGAHTLEAFSYDVDVVEKKLVPKPALMLGFYV